MIDPGALGTLHIGLDSIRLQDEHPSANRRRHAAKRRESRAVPAVAGWLRGLADRLDRPIPDGARS